MPARIIAIGDIHGCSTALAGIDTGCCNAGWLTALDVGSGEKWQVDERGRGR